MATKLKNTKKNKKKKSKTKLKTYSKKLNKAKTNHTILLVYGFINEIQIELYKNNIVNNNVPASIFDICLSFYKQSLFIWYLSQDFSKNPYGLYLCDFNNQSIRYQCNIYNLNDNQCMDVNEWQIINSGIYHAKNISIPYIIHSAICRIDISNTFYSTNNYNAIFNIRGSVDPVECCVILINCNQFNKSKMSLYKLNLPKYPQLSHSNSIIYSKSKQSLFSIGGSHRKHCYKLLFNNDHDTFNWDAMPSLNENRASPCLVSIGLNKILAIGGWGGSVHKKLKTMEMLEYNSNNSSFEWKLSRNELNVGIYNGGVFYNEFINRIYVGGYTPPRYVPYHKINQLPKGSFVEYYDIIQNKKWIKLPKTNLTHEHKPILFNDNINGNNLLYITSTSCNSMEYFDFRDNKKKWNIYTKKMSSLFNTEFPTKSLITFVIECEFCM